MITIKLVPDFAQSAHYKLTKGVEEVSHLFDSSLDQHAELQAMNDAFAENSFGATSEYNGSDHLLLKLPSDITLSIESI